MAKNFHVFPELDGVDDDTITKHIVKLTDRHLPITITARNIDYEFYWEDKCLRNPNEPDLKNVKTEQHGGSFKQAYIECHLQKVLENYKS